MAVTNYKNSMDFKNGLDKIFCPLDAKILLRLRQQLDSPVPWIGIAASGHPRPPYKRRPCDREMIGGTPSASGRP